MVDLVKIRRKAKEKKEAEDAASRAASATPVVPDESVAAAELSPKQAGAGVPDEEVSSGAEPGSAADTKEEKRTSRREPAATDPVAKAEPRRKARASSAKDDEGATVESAATTAEVAPGPTEPDRNTPAHAADDEPDEESLDRLERFKREAGKRRNWADAARASSGTVEEEASRDLELLRFRLAGEEYAVDIEKIVEIVPPRATTRVPNADPSIVGIMSLRGTIVTVFDLRRRLKHPRAGDGENADRRLIVVEREGETAGFLVDRVSRVVKLDPSELESHPVVSSAEQSDYVRGVFQAPDGLVILLDLERILASQN